MRESPEEALQRWQKLAALQAHYPTFGPFLEDMMAELGFDTSEVQLDIGGFLQYGPTYLMVMAQRSQAKTTITAIYAIWCLIHDPKFRVLIISAGGAQASEISTLVVRLITTVDILECLRPDRANGDRTSVEAFDVHYTLKGVDKSPSVACIGITGNLPGKRADLLIADDIESPKNSLTATMREQLLHISKEFTSISVGRIVYLGTPQSVQSIYNSLPSRGFTVRIWPGRYPTEEQEIAYGSMLAPYIRDRLARMKRTGFGLDGKQGEAVDPLINGEEKLLNKELDQGQAHFQLQFMLLTALSDSQRYPLKPHQLVVARLNTDHFPMTVVRGFGKDAERRIAVGDQSYILTAPHNLSQNTAPLQAKIMYIDPAGGGKNADETAYAVGGFLNSNVFLTDVGGIPGGYELDKMERLAKVVVRSRVSLVKIEKNMGFGAFREVFMPVCKRMCEEAGIPAPGFEDDLVSGQKELRIINTLEPVIGRGSLIIDEGILDREADSIAMYDIGKRNTYSFLFQLSKLTRDRNSLTHDDRLDAVEGLVRHFVAALAVDQKKAIEAKEKQQMEQWIKNPLGYSKQTLAALNRGHTASGISARMRKL